MWYIYHSNCMDNSYLMSQGTIKGTTKPPPNLPNLLILKRWILLSSCGTQYSSQYFRYFWGDYFDRKDREMIQLPFSRMAGRPGLAGTTVKGRKT
jgi:hypothetical protein